MTLKQALIVIITLVVSVPALAKPPAEDPIVFFDGYKQGWRVDSSFVTYNSEGDVVFVGYKNNEPKYIYNVDKTRFDKSYQESETLKMQSYLFGMKQKIKTGINFVKFDEGFFYDTYDGIDDWLILLYGYKKKKIHWYNYIRDKSIDYPHGYRFWKKYKFATYFDFDYNLVISNQEDLYVFSIENAFLYKIPQNMQNKIIVRDRLFYAPVSYLILIWLRSPGCKTIDDIETHYKYPSLQNNCLKFAYSRLPKGEYEVDSSGKIIVSKTHHSK